MKVNNNGDLIKYCKNLECDNYKYWPTKPNSFDFFEGNFQRVTLEEIKNSTFYDNIRIPSNDEISCYIESYCDNPSMHSNTINSDKNELLYELSYDYTDKSCYRQNLIITKSHLIDTFKYIVEVYYTYKLSYTYNGVKHEYSADNFAKTLKSLDDFHLIFSPEIEKYEKIAEDQLDKQANESKENIKLNKQKTNKLKAILDRRNKSHLITVCIIASLYVLSFVGSIIYPIILKFTSDSFFFYPVSFYQLGIALFLVGLYLFYYFHKHRFNSYRSSKYKDWQGKIHIIPDYLIDNTKRNDTIFQVFLIIIYVFASIFLLFLIMCWLLILFIH